MSSLAHARAHTRNAPRPAPPAHPARPAPAPLLHWTLSIPSLSLLRGGGGVSSNPHPISLPPSAEAAAAVLDPELVEAALGGRRGGPGPAVPAAPGPRRGCAAGGEQRLAARFVPRARFVGTAEFVMQVRESV